jgi:hypothetical protein
LCCIIPALRGEMSGRFAFWCAKSIDIHIFNSHYVLALIRVMTVEIILLFFSVVCIVLCASTTQAPTQAPAQTPTTLPTTYFKPTAIPTPVDFVPIDSDPIAQHQLVVVKPGYNEVIRLKFYDPTTTLVSLM